MLERLTERFTPIGLALFIILLAVTISVIGFVMANGDSPIGPSPETSASIGCEDDLTPVVSPCLTINAGTGLTGVDSGSGRFTLNVITPTPGAGGSGFPFEVGRSVISGGAEQLVKPGTAIDTVGTRTIVDDSLYYEPFFVRDTIGVDSLVFDVITGTGTADVCRVGIYEMDINWQPTDLVVDGGTASISAGGVKTVSITEESLSPGRYAVAFGCDANVDLRLFIGAFQSDISPSVTINAILAERILVSQNAQITGGLNASGSDWTSATHAQNGQYHYVMLGVNTP